MGTEIAWLLLASALGAQAAPDEPEAWTRKVEAAADAVKAGQSARAEVLLLEVVEEAEKRGPDDLGLAFQLERLGNFYADRRQKRPDKGEPLIRRALAIRERRLGPDHRDVAGALVSLARCRMVNGREPEDATGALLRRASAILDKAAPRDDTEIAGVLHLSAVWKMSRRDFDDAEADLGRALVLYEKAKGPGDPRVADILDDLGDLHLAQTGAEERDAIRAEDGGEPKPSGRHGELAEAFYARGLAIRDKALKADDPDIAESLYNLGQLAFIRSRATEGEPYLDRWLTLPASAGPAAGEKPEKVLMMLVMAAAERKDHARAGVLLRRIEVIVVATKGAESEDYATNLSLQTLFALKAGAFDDGERLIDRCLDAQEAKLGRNDPGVAWARAAIVGRYPDHAEEANAPARWRELATLATKLGEDRHRSELGDIVSRYADLLRRTSRAAPRPSAEDLAYLKKVGAVPADFDLDDLATAKGLDDVPLDDEGLAHAARLYDIETLKAAPEATDRGLARLSALGNLRSLDLSGSAITDAGLGRLGGLPGLRELDVSKTAVGDRGLEILAGLKDLHRLNIASTKATQAGLDRLGRARPDLLLPPAVAPPTRSERP